LWDVSAQTALQFERAVDLSSGLSTAVPAFFLTMYFFSWGFFQLKAAYLLYNFSVWNPFWRPDIQNKHREINHILAQPGWSLSRHWTTFYLVYLLAGAPALYLWFRAQPTFENKLFDGLFFSGLVAAMLIVGFNFTQFLQLWKTVRGLLKRLVLMPLDRAFDNLPAELPRMFSGYLYTSRPRRPHFHVSVRLFTRLRLLTLNPDVLKQLQSLSNCTDAQLATLQLELAPDIASDFEKEIQTTPAAADESEDTTVGVTMQKLCVASAVVLGVLELIWKQHPSEEIPRKPAPSSLRDILQWLNGRWPLSRRERRNERKRKKRDPQHALPGNSDQAQAWEWVRLAENFMAAQAVLYVSQYFVQLRNALVSVTVGTLLLLLATTSYPFQPQNLLVVYLLIMVGVVAIGTVTVLVQINRDPFVSRLSNTKPERFTPDWAFISSFATYVLPLLGVLAVQLSGSFRVWLEPVFRILK
jgi:hypothetical protein